MRHASLGFLLVDACCRRERGQEKSSSQAGHECALGVERVDLRGVWEVTESLLAKSPSGVFRFWEGEAGRAEVVLGLGLRLAVGLGTSFE